MHGSQYFSTLNHYNLYQLIFSLAMPMQCEKSNNLNIVYILKFNAFRIQFNHFAYRN